MSKKLPPLNWLRSFESSARYLNFTQAASKLNMTQAAVSQQIRSLEAHLGVPLFTRLPRGLTLTEMGLAYFPVVTEALEKLAISTHEIFGKNRAKRISICSNLTFFCRWMAPKIAEFSLLYPEISFSCTSNVWVKEYDKQADFYLSYGQGNWKGMNAERLTYDCLIPVCSPNLKNGRPPPKSPTELNDYSLLHVLGYEQGWGYWLDKMGFDQIDSSKGYEFDTLATALAIAIEGLGIVLGRSSLVEDSLKKGELIAPFGSGDILVDEAFYLIYSTNISQGSPAELFRDWLLKSLSR